MGEKVIHILISFLVVCLLWRYGRSNSIIILDVLLGWWICKCIAVLWNSSSHVENVHADLEWENARKNLWGHIRIGGKNIKLMISKINIYVCVYMYISLSDLLNIYVLIPGIVLYIYFYPLRTYKGNDIYIVTENYPNWPYMSEDITEIYVHIMI